MNDNDKQAALEHAGYGAIDCYWFDRNGGCVGSTDEAYEHLKAQERHGGLGSLAGFLAFVLIFAVLLAAALCGITYLATGRIL